MIVDIEKFKEWLQNYGCEILPTTNQYEAVRFEGREVGVLYTSGKTSGIYATRAIVCFNNKKKWDGSPIKTGRNSSYKKQKTALVERDGTCCFYCGEEMNDDITVEHLIALSCGGKNVLSNMVLAHEKCNHMVKNIPISEKVKLAIKNRSGKVNQNS